MTDSFWQKIGEASNLKLKKCRQIFAKSGNMDDLVVIFHNGQFYAMNAVCSHSGGPLYKGDIEDLGNGRAHIICPWHKYSYDVKDGKNAMGFQQEISETKVEDGNVYIKYHTELSLQAFNKDDK